MEEAKRKKEELENKTPSTSKKGQKRKPTSPSLMDMFKKKKKDDQYEIDADILKAINEDKVNKKLWTECQSAVKEGKKQFLDKVEEIFTCIICIGLVYNPVTLKCGHSLCKVRKICIFFSHRHLILFSSEMS